ncbi:MAG: cytochrome P460 family protein [Acidobacteria bacterium]|nr:cytochrome P460 family protein [Acidobacteriota bacterium]
MIKLKKLKLGAVTVFLLGATLAALPSPGVLATPNQTGKQDQEKPMNPCNPCAQKKAQNPCNPCAKKAQNPCNPCGGKMASGEVYVAATSHRGWPKVNTKPLLSKAHGGMFVTSYTNTTAQSAIRGAAASFPVGAILVKDSYANESGKPGAKGTVFAMEKTQDGWLWVTTDAKGHITGKGNNQEMKMCADCHAQAKMDYAYLRSN